MLDVAFDFRTETPAGRDADEVAGRSSDVRPRIERRTDRLGPIRSLPLSPRQDRDEFVGRQPHRNDLRSCGSTWGATPASAQLVDVVASLSLRHPLADLGLIDFASLNDAVHDLIVLRIDDQAKPQQAATNRTSR